MKKSKLLKPLLTTASLSGMVISGIVCSCSFGNNAKYTVTLYTEYGTFSNGKKYIVLSFNEATKLQQIKSYEEPLLPTLIFDKWTDDKGHDFDDTKPIDENMVLVANFKEDTESDPEDFTTDSWTAVTKVCNQQGFTPFANTYCGYVGNSEEEAKDAIRNWITTDDNIRYVWIDFVDKPELAKVRLIDIDHDQIAEKSTNAKFTFEFADIIDLAAFDEYVEPQGGGDPEDYIYCNRWRNLEANAGDEPSILNQYLNSDVSPLMDALPESLTNSLLEVTKKTIVTNSNPNDTDDISVGTAIGLSSSNCYFFPLSRGEMNDINGTDEDVDNIGVELKWEEAYNVPYTYYTDNDPAAEPTQQYEADPLRIKCFAGTNKPGDYWTRSAYLGDYKDNGSDPFMSRDDWERDCRSFYAVAGVVYDGGIFTTYSSYIGLGVAPAFCIGEEVA